MENAFNGNLLFVDWQAAHRPSTGAGWTALVRLDRTGHSQVLDCKHGHFTHFPMPG